ncbi:alpha/beta fold hydrolase [Arsenicicoccus dermatophilus]|uniref:alpha/beta fold hydrolase n=1 Tax=Arsenicicoccus dermatophilus TaxID=1076331 RepID=UPI001F4C68CA|nr:alpha/beta fold hydrolase [Arsenicicoccus dermatophilus]MCH8612452.1 alpha/beta fold hydrolase [Arsenicicoccus dermatophilus]
MTSSTSAPDLSTFSRAGLTFDVQDGGPRDGAVVVLLHGFPQDSSSWELVAPRLHDAGLRTLAPDQRGYSPGASPREVSAYRGPELVADVLALMDAAGAERVHLVGHDWGGAVAWLVAQRAPHRLASLTVLSTPHPAALALALRTPDQLRKSWYIGAFQVPRVPELVLSRRMMSFLTSAGLPAEVAQRYARRFATPASLRGPIGWYRATTLVRPARPRSGAAGGAGAVGGDGRITVPTTYVWGSQDVALGRAAAEATERFVDAPCLFVELDASHWLPESEPQEVADAILDRVGRSRGPLS